MNSYEEIQQFDLGSVLDLITDHLDDLVKLKSTFTELNIINDLDNQLTQSKSLISTLINIYGEEGILKNAFSSHDNYIEKVLAPRLATSSLFIENPDISIHTFKKEVESIKDPVKLYPYLKAYLNSEKQMEEVDES